MASYDSTVAFLKNDDFDTLPGTPTYYLPGRNITFDDLSIDNALEPIREPGKSEAVNQLAGRLEGGFSCSWVMTNTTHDDVRDIIYNDSGGGFDVGSDPATSTWYVGVDYSGGTAERELRSVTPTEHTITYDAETNTIEESVTAVFADENLNTAITPSSIVGPADDDEVPFHGLDLQIDGTTVTRLRNATYSVSNIAQMVPDASRTFTDNVLAAPEISLETTADFENTDYIEDAYGSGGATSPTSGNVSSQSATLTFSTASGTTVATYSIPEVKPANYGWEQLVSRENPLAESITWNASGDLSIS